jgi:dolichol-phosphate mannosyltransferase
LIEVSIISPVYNAEVLISELISRIEIEISKITEHYEIILVEDGSDDNGWNIIKENCNRNLRIKGVKLSRNFGQHNAIAAGINEANGNFAIIMDCDLQDNPIYFREMYHSAKIEGYDVVYTKKFKREHGKLKNLTAWLYNLVFNWLIDNKKWAASDNVGNYSIISKKVIDAYKT